MTQRRIDPTLYVQAADAFEAIASSSDTIGSSASSSAGGFARMAGDDPGGEQFATAYDELAGHALQNIFDIGIRANSMDRLFMASGANAAAAEAYAAGKPFDPGAFPLRDPRQSLSIAGPPSAFGGDPAAEPDAWEFVKDIVGMMWPNADTDQLDAAAGAWQQIAADVRSLATDVRQGDNPVASLDSAELVSARAAVTDFASDVGEVADAIEELGGLCSTYADDVRDAHNEVIQMLVQLAIEIAATVAISAALSVFTFGASAAVGAGAMAVRIATIGGRIITIFLRVGGTAARVALRIRAIRARLIPLATNFRRTAQAVINITSGTSAAVTAEVVVKGGDANVLVAFGSGLIGGGVTEAIVAPFGRYGQRVVVQALAGGAGGAASGAADGLLSDGSIDIRQVIIGGVGGAGFAGFGARSGSGRSGSTSAADPGAGTVRIDEGRTPVLAGGGADSASVDGGRPGSTDYDGPTVTASDVTGSGGDGGGHTGSTDYDGPTVTGSDVTGSGGDGGGQVRVPDGEAPQSPSIDVTNNGTGGSDPVDIPTGPADPVDLGGPGTSTDSGADAPSGTGNAGDGAGTPDGDSGSPTRPDDPDDPETPIFNEVEDDLGVDYDGLQNDLDDAFADAHQHVDDAFDVTHADAGESPSPAQQGETAPDGDGSQPATSGEAADADASEGDVSGAVDGPGDAAPTAGEPSSTTPADASGTDGGNDTPSGPVGSPGDPVNYESGVRFFGPEQLKYYLANNATLGRPGDAVFMMPEADASNVHDALSAAIESGMAPSAMNAWRNGDDIFGAMIPMDGVPQRLPTAQDAGSWPHFVPGGYTAVNIGGEFFLNPTREFVIDGGIPLPPGTIVFRLGDGGVWDILAIHG